MGGMERSGSSIGHMSSSAMSSRDVRAVGLDVAVLRGEVPRFEMAGLEVFEAGSIGGLSSGEGPVSMRGRGEILDGGGGKETHGILLSVRGLDDAPREPDGAAALPADVDEHLLGVLHGWLAM